jgi:hypothetical protein
MNAKNNLKFGATTQAYLILGFAISNRIDSPTPEKIISF